VTVRILQIWVIILGGGQVVAKNCRAEILKRVQQDTVQEDLKASVHAFARCRGRRRIRSMNFALSVVVDQAPVATVRVVSDSVLKAGEHGFEVQFEAQEGRALVGEPFRDLGPLVRFGDGQTRTVAGHVVGSGGLGKPLGRSRQATRAVSAGHSGGLGRPLEVGGPPEEK
jgi:hypothetical protein